MNPVLKKLMYKGQSPVLLLGVPEEFKKIESGFGVPIHSVAKASYSFVLAFAKSMAEAEKIAKAVSKVLEEKAIFWLAYPKGTSKRYKGADINRDSGHLMMAKQGYDGVSLVAIDEDWSAMRYKKL
jgi:hypothetical protein